MYIIVDLVKRGVLSLVSDMRRYTNNRYYYYYSFEHPCHYRYPLSSSADHSRLPRPDQYGWNIGNGR